MERNRGVQATEVNLVPEQAGVGGLRITLGPLVFQLTADIPHVAKREADAADDDRAPRGAVGAVVGPENHVVEVDELPRLTVVPVECTDAGADVWLHAGVADR